MNYVPVKAVVYTKIDLRDGFSYTLQSKCQGLCDLGIRYERILPESIRHLLVYWDVTPQPFRDILIREQGFEWSV